MFRTHEEIFQAIMKAGVSRPRAEMLSRLAKPALWLECGDLAGDADLPRGVTKVGGWPDMPPDAEWPVRGPYSDASKRVEEARELVRRMGEFHDGDPDADEGLGLPADFHALQIKHILDRADATTRPRALAFVAQINLPEMWDGGISDPDMPRDGRLLFFYDLECEPAGLWPSDSEGMRLIYDPSPVQSLKPRPAPEGCRTLGAKRCFARPILTLQPILNDDYLIGDNDDPDHRPYVDFYHDGMDDWGRGSWHDHRFGGHPTQVQKGMQRDCQLLHMGLAVTSDRNDPQAKGITAEELGEWLLLFQIASDESCGMYWGDFGYLYVWIRREDLKVHQFSKAQFQIQST